MACLGLHCDSKACGDMFESELSGIRRSWVTALVLFNNQGWLKNGIALLCACTCWNFDWLGTPVFSVGCLGKDRQGWMIHELNYVFHSSHRALFPWRCLEAQHLSSENALHVWSFGQNLVHCPGPHWEEDCVFHRSLESRLYHTVYRDLRMKMGFTGNIISTVRSDGQLAFCCE